MKDLESISSFFGSGRSKNTLRKAHLAYMIEEKIKAEFGQSIKAVIGRTVNLVCVDGNQISYLRMRQKKIESMLSKLLGQKETRLSFRIKE